ncbi:MAG: hypothetical protein WAU78_04865 [Roseiarcus sp.]
MQRLRRAPAPRRSAFALAPAAPRLPAGPSPKSPRQFLSDNRNSRYGESRARSAGHRGAAHRGRDDAEIWRKRDSGLTGDNPLVFLKTAKEKVWKSLEKFGNPRNFLGKAWNFLGKVWKSLEKLEVAATGYSTP